MEVDPGWLGAVFNLWDSKIPRACQKVTQEVDVKEGFENLHDDVELVVFECYLSFTKQLDCPPRTYDSNSSENGSQHDTIFDNFTLAERDI